MMKKLYSFLLLIFSLALSGQVMINTTNPQKTVSPASTLTEMSPLAGDVFSIAGGEGFIILYNLPSSPATVQVVSLTGTVVKTININSPGNTEKLELENFPAGIYLINVQNKNGFQAVRKAYLR